MEFATLSAESLLFFHFFNVKVSSDPKHESGVLWIAGICPKIHTFSGEGMSPDPPSWRLTQEATGLRPLVQQSLGTPLPVLVLTLGTDRLICLLDLSEQDGSDGASVEKR